VKKRKGFGNKRGPTRSWLDKQFRRGFRGYPVATVAFYGPSDELATKIVVSVFLTEGDEPDSLKRWFTEDQTDIRDDPAIGEEILTFFKTHAPRSTVVTDAIIGCPHEEGTDYPQDFLSAVSLLGGTGSLYTRAYSVNSHPRDLAIPTSGS